MVLVTLTGVSDTKGLQGRAFSCTTGDISEGGIRLTGEQKIPVGTRLDIRIAAVEPPAAFRLAGRVTWLLEVASPPAYFVGIEFERGDEAMTKHWAAFVAARLRAQAAAGPGKG